MCVFRCLNIQYRIILSHGTEVSVTMMSFSFTFGNVFKKLSLVLLAGDNT